MKKRVYAKIVAMKKLIVIGGGAAGFFGAIAAREENPELDVVLLESSKRPLAKVRVSGGGRCNVTHACFDPGLLVKNYPRGEKELRGPFNRFNTKDTIEWFAKRGVELKVEKDGRMFPVTDSSETIIDCLLEGCRQVDIRLGEKVEGVLKEGDRFIVTTKNGVFEGDYLLMATGSSPIGHEIAKSFGHTIVEPVPSLFTFNIPTSPLLELSGLSVEMVELQVGPFKRRGPLLLTHWGFSGPAALALSAFAARFLHGVDYKADLLINWLPELSWEKFLAYKQELGLKSLMSQPLLPKKLWKKLLELASIDPEIRANGLSKASMQKFFQKLTKDSYRIEGKSTNKEEFVTAGGVALNEVNFKTMESKCCKGLYFAGEILDIDGITGGFNFQAAWTTSYLVGMSLVER